MGLLSTLFPGGSKSANNQAYPFLQGQLGSSVGYVPQAGDAISKFLSGDTSGFDAYKNNTGFNFALSQGLKGVTGAEAAKGLLRSGSAGQAFQNYGQNLEQQSAGDYLQQLLGLGNLGLGAAQTIDSAGQQSQEEEHKGGLLGLVGGALSLFSDRDAKRDIELLRREPDGLGVYAFRYLWDAADAPLREGVMADEVAELRPWALGPEQNGFRTIDYSRLEAA